MGVPVVDPGTGVICGMSLAAGTNDIHVISAQGDRYDFCGEVGKYFNIFTDYFVQINSLFKEWNGTDGGTVMEIIGAKIGTDKLTFCTMDMNGIATVNGRELEIGEEVRFPVGLNNMMGIAKLTDEFEGYDPLGEKYIPSHTGYFQGRLLAIDLGYYVFNLIHNYQHVSNPGSSPYFVNFTFNHRVDFVRPHGAIGQILDFDGVPRIGYGMQGEGAIDGVYQDYEVSSLWSDDFLFNQFGILPAWLKSA